MIRLATFAAIVCVLGILGSGRALSAEEAPTADEIKSLVQKLSEPDAAVREATEKKLVGIGKPVIDAVAAAAESGNLEVVTRCVAILAELRKSTDKPTSAAAETALKKLSESKNRSVARRANAVINPNVQGNPNQGFPGAQVQIGVAMVNNGARISITNRNGDKTLTADENGQKTELSVKATGEIVVKITKNDDKGKPQTTTAEAKTADDLKKQNPDAFKVYEKYLPMLNGNGLNVIIGNRVRGGQLVPIQGGFQPVPFPQADTTGLKKDLESAIDDLRKATSRLKDLSAKGPVAPEDLKKAIDDFEVINQKLIETRKKLEP